MEGMIFYTIGCLTGLLIGLMLLQMQAHFLKHETGEKNEKVHYVEKPDMSADEEDKLRKQFDNFLTYNGKAQDDT